MNIFWKQLKNLLDIIIRYLKIIIKSFWKNFNKLLEFLISDTSIRILGALVICSAIYLKETLSKEKYPVLSLVFPLLIGSLFLFYNPLSDALKKRREKRK
jgi:hypothetical protein